MWFILGFGIISIILAVTAYIFREDGLDNFAISVNSTVIAGIFFIIALSLLCYVGSTTSDFVLEKAQLYAFSNNIDAYLISIGMVKDALIKEPYTINAKLGLGINIENKGQSTNNTIVAKEYRDYIVTYNQKYFELKCKKETWILGQYIWSDFPTDLKPYKIPTSYLGSK